MAGLVCHKPRDWRGHFLALYDDMKLSWVISIMKSKTSST